MQEHFQRLLEILRTEFGAEVELSGDGLEATIPANGFLLMISHLRSTGQILVSTAVGPLREENREEMLFELLNGQYYFQRTAGATLAVDNGRAFVTLQLARHLSTLDETCFATLVENYLRAADYWRTRLEAGGRPAASAPGAGAPNGAGAAAAGAESLSDDDLMRAAMSMIAV